MRPASGESAVLMDREDSAVRLEYLKRLYASLDRLARMAGGYRRLQSCAGRMAWPERGIYFFFEDREVRHDSGAGPRIVRVGTHALKPGSRTTLWNRLSQHRGTARGGGNHRGSVFRLHVGGALLNRDTDLQCASWSVGQSAPREVRVGEEGLEAMVSEVIGRMPFLWIDIDDPAGPESRRGYIERNAIALLSNYRKEPLDPPSPTWLGRHCPSQRVRGSGLWNYNHVDETCDSLFLDELKRAIAQGQT